MNKTKLSNNRIRGRMLCKKSEGAESRRLKKRGLALISALLAVFLILSPFSGIKGTNESGIFTARVMAAQAGEYPLSASLSCYVNAMGGVEFGAPLLTGTTLIVGENGNESIRMTFTKSSVTIYSVTCDTFIDPAPSYVTDDRGVTSGTIGYYDQNGNLVTDGITYTLSGDTALNASDEAVHYVDSITFPIDSRRAAYGLTLYINSNVMGVQFTNPNSQATAATYQATLTVSWDGVPAQDLAPAQAEDLNGAEGDGQSGAEDSGENTNDTSLQTDSLESAAAGDSASGNETTVAGEGSDSSKAGSSLGDNSESAGTGENSLASAGNDETGGQTSESEGSDAGSVTAESKSGLSIYKVEQNSEDSADDAVLVREAVLNKTALIIIAICAAACFVAGGIICLTQLKKKSSD